MRTANEIQSEMAKVHLDLDNDPVFVADYLKGVLVEDILKQMEEAGVSRNELAQRLGKSRQYVSRILNEKANFTIETMAQITCSLNCNLSIKITKK